MKVKGIKRGKTIELIEDISIPDGVEVSVEFPDVVTVVKTTESFQKDLDSLDKARQKQVLDKIHFIVNLTQSNDFSFLELPLNSIERIKLSEYTSSIYELSVAQNLRVLLFFEDDPIFNQKVLTLLRVFPRSDMEKVLKSLAESYYQQELLAVEDTDNGE